MRRLITCLTIASLAFAATAARAGEIAERRGPAEPFSFERLIENARALAEKPYAATPIRAAETLDKIDYDAHWKIRFRPQETVTIGEGAPVQFFHMGRYFKEPVRLYEVRDGEAREILYSPAFFDMPDDSPAKQLPSDIGFAGFRVMRENLETDWISFLGAAYFRTDGASHQYGQSARGLAIDTGLSKAEEFPRFTAFWLAEPETADQVLTIYALLDSPSVAGAYKMALANREGEGQMIDIDSRLFFRNKVERLGVAPLTSMFWYSETNRSTGLDWRPEVHDTDGLAIVSADGERIWRPLNNPREIRTSSFMAHDVKGFGLAQRDRVFENYQDDSVFYDRRPSVWIEPLAPFGEGSVQLVEIPTDDEIFDNIVAYFAPSTLPELGAEMRFAYRMYWKDAHPRERGGAEVVSTRVGQGGVPGQPRPGDQIKVVVDFDGAALEGLTKDDGLQPVVELSTGEAINPYLLPVVGTSRWRLVFDAKVLDHNPIEARAYLKTDKDVLTETWLGQISHEMVSKEK